MKKIGSHLVIVLLFGSLILCACISWQNRRKIEYKDCLQETAFTIDGEQVPMKWLALYIVYEEQQVEEQARIYNPDNTMDYWNLHGNGCFVRQEARDAIMQMAIHDYIFYQKACERNLSLDSEEQRSLENRMTDFWMDLIDGQEERIPVTAVDLAEAMRCSALAEKYQEILAEEEGSSFTAYSWNGGYYEKWLKEQDVQINESLWNRITVGEITLSHTRVNYINGYSEKESEEQ